MGVIIAAILLAIATGISLVAAICEKNKGEDGAATAFAFLAMVLLLMSVGCGFAAKEEIKNTPREFDKPLVPDTTIVYKNGVADTTYTYYFDCKKDETK
jgi:hypothetical protein